MPRKNPVREWLRTRGCPEHVVEGGLAGLVSSWQRTAESVAQGYELGIDDYLNDMDGRELLHAALAAAGAADRVRYRARIQAADRKIKARLLPAGLCLWGEKEAAARGWTPEVNWWYFRALK
jgi:hypothetical protein